MFDPLHYLALIERKPGALDQAAPLQHWDLPEPFAHLRRLLEARMARKGKREYIQVLRLMELFARDVVAAAITDAIKLGAISFDAVKQLTLARVELRCRSSTWRPTRICQSLRLRRHGRPTTRHSWKEPQQMSKTGKAKTADTPQVLLEHHLKALRLPTFLAEYEKQARECAAAGVDHARYLLRLAELELIERERRLVDRRIRAA